MGTFEESLICEEFAWGDPGFATAAGSTLLASYPIITGGTEEQKMKYLSKASEGVIFSCNVFVNVSDNQNKKVSVKIFDEGQGFKEKDTSKIFKRFYSNRPKSFGKHSGLGLNIVKNIVELHEGTISASNRSNKRGAQVEVLLPKFS